MLSDHGWIRKIESIRDFLELHVKVACGGSGGSNYDYMGTHVGRSRSALLTIHPFERRDTRSAAFTVSPRTCERAMVK
jgi:hypothetical protein